MINIFSRKKPSAGASIQSAPVQVAPVQPAPAKITPGQMTTMPPAQPIYPVQAQTGLAEIALNNINNGVIITGGDGRIRYINPAAVVMTDCRTPENALGLDYALLIKIESKDGREFSSEENPITRAFSTNQLLENYDCTLLSGPSAKRIPISITVIPAEGGATKIITFRNIEKELAEESEQTEFISTASHEMRTPVATIDGYLALCLNPQTATVDDRARGYLDSAKKASEHLGKLFQDLLDVTKLDDGRIRPNFVPVEVTSLVQQIATDHAEKAKSKNLSYIFGAKTATPQGEHRLSQVTYASVDVDFMREILDNLLDNAIKYTPEGGAIYVNVVGDGGNVIISVADTGIGISSEDLAHVFQKFYRADNSDTREIGGTGLGLYLVKQRTEAMGGRVWAESAVGEGTTFYVSLPRISPEEYNKRMIVVQNNQMINNNQGGTK